MTCYFRHLREFFDRAGVEVTSENKRQIDQIIHDITGSEYKNCSATWKRVRKCIVEDEEAFVSQFKKALSQDIL